MYTIHLFCKIIKYRFFAQIEYPGAFLAGILAQWLVYGIEMLMMFLVVWNFGSLKGWEPTEIVFLFAIWVMTYALAATFAFNICQNFSRLSIEGTMDEALTRPVSPFAYLLATHVNVGYVSHISLATVAIIYSILQLQIHWTISQWLWFFVLLFCGAIITGCLMLLCYMPAMLTRSESPLRILFWQSRTFGSYPLTIYPGGLQLFFTIFFPVAFIGFYPVQALLGKQEGLFTPIAIWLSPVVAVILIALTICVWKKISIHYESAGT